MKVSKGGESCGFGLSSSRVKGFLGSELLGGFRVF